MTKTRSCLEPFVSLCIRVLGGMSLLLVLGVHGFGATSWAFPPSNTTKPEPRPNWVEVLPVQVKHFAGMSTKSPQTHTTSTQTKSNAKTDPHAGGQPDPHAGLSNDPHANTTDPHAGLGGNPHDSSDPHAGLPVKPVGTSGAKKQASTPSQPESAAEQLRVLAMRMSREQNQLFQRLITLIISPCCWTQPVSLHASSMSDTIRIDLMQRLIAGHTESQILDAYKKRFGERVLSIPDKSYIFLIPIAASFLALVLVGFLILRWSQRNSTTVPVSSLEPTSSDTTTSATEANSSPSASQEGSSRT